jgi:hypothetical protein
MIFLRNFVAIVIWMAVAQPSTLTVSDSRILTRPDAFGQEQQILSGTLVNNSDDAYANVQIFVELYNAADEIVGEGLGVLSNQCGISAPLDYALEPAATARFTAILDLYEPDALIARREFIIDGEALAPTEQDETPVQGIVQVVNQEVAAVEWITDTDDAGTIRQSLIYGVGCQREVFTHYDWFSYDAASDTTRAISHPREAEATDATLRERLELQDEGLFNRSLLSFAPNGGQRLVYQDDINTLRTSEADGTYQRILDEELFRSTLQGFLWLPDERFVAYYYGAYGEPVTYLAASTFGGYFSTPERFSTPSMTVPGAAPDLSTLIISGQFNEDTTTGFYLKPPAAERYSLLFAWQNLPGNNYPAPVYRSRGGLAAEDVIYFDLPNEDGAHLYCYDRRESTLFNLAPLPFTLNTEDRASMTLAPDNQTLALYASGTRGGLWLIDLMAFDACQ